MIVADKTTDQVIRALVGIRYFKESSLDLAAEEIAVRKKAIRQVLKTAKYQN